MTILSAQTIERLKPLEPLKPRTVSHGLTFGISSCGYDIRVAENILMWPTRFVLASSVEKFNMPNNICARVMDKSSWARQGICVQNTFIEPGWRGFLTLEITNHSWNFVKLKSGMPIAQIVFEFLDEPTKYPYKGKYQDQEIGAQAARLVNVK